MVTPVVYHIMMGSIAFESPASGIGHKLKGVADIVEYGSHGMIFSLFV